MSFQLGGVNNPQLGSNTRLSYLGADQTLHLLRFCLIMVSMETEPCGSASKYESI